MKNFIKIIVISCLILIAFCSQAQDTELPKSDTSNIYLVEKHDGVQFTGALISQDMREVIIKTKTGVVAIPRHEVKTIRKLKEQEIDLTGEYMPSEVFSTRYFITTNGMPIEKGESYVLINLYGPEVHLGLADNFGVGIMTSWLAIPIIGSLKYSIPINEKTSVGIGTLIGTGSWGLSDVGGILPYGMLSYGDRRKNINFSAGFGTVWTGGGNNEGRFLCSVAGMTKVRKNISLVFDSFISPGVNEKQESFAIIIPGLRFQTRQLAAIQFGFAGLFFENEILALPVPFFQWFRKF